MFTVDRKDPMERKGSKLKKIMAKEIDRGENRRHNPRNGRGVGLGGERQQGARRTDGGPWGKLMEALCGSDGDGMGL